MTIQLTFPNGTGGTDYYIWPPGIGHVDSIIETFDKITASSFTANSFIVPSIRDIIGDRQYTFGTTEPFAVTTAIAGPGTTTCSAKRTAYMSVPAWYSSPSTVSTNQGADAGLRGRPDGPVTKIVKPSAETWSTGSNNVVYGYLSGGVTLYTNNSPTASSALVGWLVGRITVNRFPGDTDGYVSLASFSIGGNYNNDRYVIGKGMNGIKTINVPTTGTPPNIFLRVFCSPDRMLVSSTVSATTPIYLGICIARDATGTNPVFSYLPSDIGSTAGVSYERLTESLNIGHKTFVQLNAGTTAPIRLIRQRQTPAGGVYDSVNAYSFIMGNTSDPLRVADMCFDPILPAPFDNLRVIWSQDTSTGGLLSPSFYRHTSATAPISGMVATGRVRNDLERFLYGVVPPMEFRYTACDFAHEQKYIFSAQPTLNGSDGSIPAVRAGSIGAGVVSGGAVSCSTMLCKYGVRDASTGLFVVLPGYPAVTFTAASATPTTNWYGTMPAPAPTYIEYDAIAQFYVMASCDGGAYTPLNGDYIPTSLAGSLPIYPFDVVRCSTLSDAGGAWAGNTGWRWNQLPNPVLTWGAAPAASFNAGTGQVTLSVFTSVPYTVAAGHGVINAFSGTVTTTQLQLMGYRLDWIGLADDLQPATRANTISTGGGLACNSTIVLSTVSFKPVTGATTLRVIIYVQATPPHPYALGQINEYVIDIAVP